jgi:hypothetical protein
MDALYWALVGGVVGFGMGCAASLVIFHVVLKRHGL